MEKTEIKIKLRKYLVESKDYEDYFELITGYKSFIEGVAVVIHKSKEYSSQWVFYELFTVRLIVSGYVLESNYTRKKALEYSRKKIQEAVKLTGKSFKELVADQIKGVGSYEKST